MIEPCEPRRWHGRASRPPPFDDWADGGREDRKVKPSREAGPVVAPCITEEVNQRGSHISGKPFHWELSIGCWRPAAPVRASRCPMVRWNRSNEAQAQKRKPRRASGTRRPNYRDHRGPNAGRRRRARQQQRPFAGRWSLTRACRHRLLLLRQGDKFSCPCKRWIAAQQSQLPPSSSFQEWSTRNRHAKAHPTWDATADHVGQRPFAQPAPAKNGRRELRRWAPRLVFRPNEPQSALPLSWNERTGLRASTKTTKQEAVFRCTFSCSNQDQGRTRRRRNTRHPCTEPSGVFITAITNRRLVKQSVSPHDDVRRAGFPPHLRRSSVHLPFNVEASRRYRYIRQTWKPGPMSTAGTVYLL